MIIIFYGDKWYIMHNHLFFSLIQVMVFQILAILCGLIEKLNCESIIITVKIILLNKNQRSL